MKTVRVKVVRSGGCVEVRLVNSDGSTNNASGRGRTMAEAVGALIMNYPNSCQCMVFTEP